MSESAGMPSPGKRTAGARIAAALRRDRYLIAMVIPAIVLLVVFRYIPIYGVSIAFQKYRIGHGFLDGPWVGFEHFAKFIRGPFFFRLMRNTFLLGLYSLLWGFPLPILLAVSLNELKDGPVRKSFQTISYLPYFVSTVVIIGIVKEFLSVHGLVNSVIESLGGKPIDFFSEASWFRTIYIGSAIWQNMGFGAIIYLAALSGVSPEMYESATIDGASRLQKIWYVSLPAILPTIMIQLILAVGGILGNDSTKILLIYSPVTYETADVIGTYTYRMGIEKTQFSYTTAVGLFTSAINFLFLVVTNKTSEKLTENSLW